MLVAFNKPFGILSQFNPNPDEPEQETLKGFGLPKSVVPLGRLDMDSEGLLLFTDEKALEHKLLHPRFQHRRRYLVLVEGEPEPSDLEPMRQGGLIIKGHKCLPCRARAETATRFHLGARPSGQGSSENHRYLAPPGAA